MKILQSVLAVVGAIALVVVLAGVVLPASFAVERSARIAAPAEKIYDYVVEPRQWARWNNWTRRDPAMHIIYSGPPFGQHAKWAWESGKVGSGSMEITRVVPNRLVEYNLHLEGVNLNTAGAVRLEPAGEATRVVWTQSGDVGGNPLKHYIAVAMDRMVGPDFEAGLANLKALAERGDGDRR